MTYLLGVFCCILILAFLILWRHAASEREYLKQIKIQAIEELNLRCKEQEDELSLLLNAFDDALIIVDDKEIIKLANRAAIQLSKGRKLRGKSIVQVFLNEEVANEMRNAVRMDKPSRHTILLPSGSFGIHHEFEESAWILDVAPLEVKLEEKLTRIILRDITSEHRTDQIKREFVANASHELRTPLTIINGYIENLIDDSIIDNPVMARKFLGTMRKHGNRLSDLVEDMLSLSKLESGESGLLDITTFPLLEVFEDIEERLTPMTQEHKSKIKLNLEDKNILFTGDRFYWEQILFNLAENALKQNATQKIVVTLSAKKQGKYFQIMVKDNGKGIPSSHLPYIFNRFYRAQKHHSQNEIKGTGLGLSIVKHAVESHQGEIKVDSSPGEFTTFTITLPLSSVENDD